MSDKMPSVCLRCVWHRAKQMGLMHYCPGDPIMHEYQVNKVPFADDYCPCLRELETKGPEVKRGQIELFGGVEYAERTRS